VQGYELQLESSICSYYQNRRRADHEWNHETSIYPWEGLSLTISSSHKALVESICPISLRKLCRKPALRPTPSALLALPSY
jgi:hypothetical protein